MNWTYFPERMLGSSVLDRPLLNKNGDAVGNVEDLIIDSNNKVTKLIISTGEVLGIGGREVALPFRPLGFSIATCGQKRRMTADPWPSRIKTAS